LCRPLHETENHLLKNSNKALTLPMGEELQTSV